MRSTTARPAISQVAGDARTSTLDEQDAQDRRHVAGIGKLALLLFAAVALWPSRRSRFGDIEGRQAARGGDSPQGFPLEASEARSALGAKASVPGAAEKKCAAPAETTHPRQRGAISSPPAPSSTATGR